MTVGVVGVLAGGSGSPTRTVQLGRGRSDGAIRAGIIGALGMLVSASLYPLMPTASWCVAWLIVVNFFAAFPWGAASAAVAQVTPASLRAQGAAIYFVVLSLVSASLGPSAVAWITEDVFHDPHAVGYSLAIVNAVGSLAIAATLLASGMSAFRTTVATRDVGR